MLRAFCLTLLLGAGSLSAAELTYSTVPGHGGLPLVVVEGGVPDGPEILLLHGFSQSHLSFLRQLQGPLAQEFRLVAFDFRGHGASPKPWRSEDYAGSDVWADDVARVIAAKELDNPVLVGWSYGGFVVVDYLRHYGSGRIAGVNLVGSLGGLVPPGPPPEDLDEEFVKEQQRNSANSRIVHPLKNLEASEFLSRLLSTMNMTEEEHRHAYAMQIMMPAYVRRLMGDRNYNNTDMLARIDLPVLLTRGSEDFAMPDAGTDKVLSALPDARLSTYPDTGHLPFIQLEERFNSELAAFVRELN